EVLEELGDRMAHLNISKEEMCLIGDTHYDAEGANRFGIRCIGITYGFGTGGQLKEAGAYRVCGSIEDAVREIHKM
ncbi:HAD hydrolase-like protein, partial [Acinetobacter baumannii]|nr:HAD hydrolase-like protein [Acinetobacter baumannii]